MKVTHRIALSTGLLLALLVAVLLYNLMQLGRLVEMQEGLTRIDLSATTRSLELARLLDELERTTKKLVVSRDAGYAERLEALRQAIETELGHLAELPLKTDQRQAADRLADLWREMPVEALATAVLGEELDRAAENELTEMIDNRGEELRRQAEAIGAATQQAMRAEAAAAVEAGQRAATVSKVTMVVVATVSLPLLFFTLASIREPLRRLRAGALSVTEGAFDVELEAEGNDEFSGVAASFNEMVRRLGELDRLKREFLSHVSHELKAPLAAMQETNRALLDEVPGAVNDKQRRLLELNLQSNERLSAMIGKLLDLARLEEGGIDYRLRPTELGELTREVVEGFAAAAREKGVALTQAPAAHPLLARCDRDRIIQVIANLVENAIKFTPGGGAIEITITPEAPDRIAVRVADTGPGVPDEHKKKIFTRFHQVGAPGTSSGGVGLGLAICREIVGAHHGGLRVEDNPGRGSVFVVTLPAASSSGARRAAS